MPGEHQLSETVLFDKIFASMLAGAIGDAMGGPVEGWHWQRIAETHGVVDTLLPYDQPPDFHSHFDLAPGSYTDDTRLKHLLCRTILDHDSLPTRGDFVKTLSDAYYAAEDDLERGFLEEYALAGIHGNGKLIWGGQPTNGFIMANSALGLICPCDPETAFNLSFDLDFISMGYARYSSAIAATAVAAAMQPDATATSIIDEALATCGKHRREGELSRQWGWYEHVFQLNERLVDTAVSIASRHRDVFAVRQAFYEQLQVSPLGSEAAQTLAVALGMLVAADGDLAQTIIGCVNYGRDNDSYASVAGAIAGAMHGRDAIPDDWRQTLEAANPEPDMRYLAEGLTAVASRRQQKMQAVTQAVDVLLRPHLLQ
ncbi:MAG: hypothetical protein GY759_13840 [Chloroflexi bacterium]|nr:hypothetical protein [Chloroflexota bacterium]